MNVRTALIAAGALLSAALLAPQAAQANDADAAEVAARNAAIVMCRTSECRQNLLLRKIDPHITLKCLRHIYAGIPAGKEKPNAREEFVSCYVGHQRSTQLR